MFLFKNGKRRICLHPGWLKERIEVSFGLEEVIVAGEVRELRGTGQMERGEGGIPPPALPSRFLQSPTKGSQGSRRSAMEIS